MLHESELWNKYQKWIQGIAKVNSRIESLEKEQESLRKRINDDIEESPDEMVDLQTKLHHIDQEIKSAKEIKSEFTAKRPFTTDYFVSEFNKHITELTEKLKDPLDKAIKARAALKEALGEYLKVHQEYSTEYANEKAQWESLYRNIDGERKNHFNVFRGLKDAEYLKSSLFEEITTGTSINDRTVSVIGE